MRFSAWACEARAYTLRCVCCRFSSVVCDGGHLHGDVAMVGHADERLRVVVQVRVAESVVGLLPASERAEADTKKQKWVSETPRAAPSADDCDSPHPPAPL